MILALSLNMVSLLLPIMEEGPLDRFLHGSIMQLGDNNLDRINQAPIMPGHKQNERLTG